MTVTEALAKLVAKLETDHPVTHLTRTEILEEVFGVAHGIDASGRLADNVRQLAEEYKLAHTVNISAPADALAAFDAMTPEQKATVAREMSRGMGEELRDVNRE